MLVRGSVEQNQVARLPGEDKVTDQYLHSFLPLHTDTSGLSLELSSTYMMVSSCGQWLVVVGSG